jgi:hypothetical protein
MSVCKDVCTCSKQIDIFEKGTGNVNQDDTTYKQQEL